jgi:hypothetical protein
MFLNYGFLIPSCGGAAGSAKSEIGIGVGVGIKDDINV